MRIGIIGGLARAEPHYERLAVAAGHRVLLHGGILRGRGIKALERLADGCDLVVVITDVNSHGAVQHVRRRLRERGRSPLLLRRLGLTRFATLLAALEAADARGALAGVPEFAQARVAAAL
ncbi:MAG TPA: DUF2325 domain-containing protein [Anaeromyxobacteraceae bacterium]|nr:DUF2325 domain-containing protein [Anaeromyxobacteraceae bacterium]